MAPSDRPSPSTTDQLEQVSRALRVLLNRTPASMDDKIELLAGAMVVEAFQPHWQPDRSPAEAYEALRRSDPELADAIDAIAPMLLARLEAREVSASAIAAVEELLREGR